MQLYKVLNVSAAVPSGRTALLRPSPHHLTRTVLRRSGGVEDLLERDFAKKQAKIDPELQQNGLQPQNEDEASTSSSRPLKSKRRRRELMAAVQAGEKGEAQEG